MTSADEPTLLGGSLVTPQNLSNYWHAVASCSDDVFERLWDRRCIIERRERTMPPQLLTQRADGHLPAERARVLHTDQDMHAGALPALRGGLRGL